MTADRCRDIPKHMFMLRKFFSFSLKGIATLAFLVILFRKVDLNAAWAILRSVNLFYYLLALAISFVNIGFLGAVRWRILMDFTPEVNFKELCKLTFVGRAMNTIFPGNFLGDVIRAFKVSDHDLPREFLLASVVTDRLVALIGMIFLSAIGLSLPYGLLIEANLFLYAVMVIGSILVGTCFIYSRLLLSVTQKVKYVFGDLGDRLFLLLRSLNSYREKKRPVAYAFVIAVISTFLTITIFYLISVALSVDVSYKIWFAFVPIVTIISMVPLTIGGLGLRDGAMILLLNTIDVPEPESLSISLLYFLIIVVDSVIGVILYFDLEVRKSLQEQQA